MQFYNGVPVKIVHRYTGKKREGKVLISTPNGPQQIVDENDLTEESTSEESPKVTLENESSDESSDIQKDNETKERTSSNSRRTRKNRANS